MKKLKVGLKRIFGRKSTEQKNAESAHTAPAESSVNKEIYSEPLRTVHEVEGTPFHVIMNDYGEGKTKDAQIVIGNQIASQKKFKNVDEAMKYIHNKPWQLIYATVGILTQKFQEFKKNA